jgi:cell division protein FtsN
MLPQPIPNPLPERKPLERKPPEPKAPEQKSVEVRDGNTSAYTVQVGAFREKRMAETLQQRLRQRGYSASVTTSGMRTAKFYRVRVGGFDTQANAKRLVDRLKSQLGLKAVVTSSD